MRKPAAAERRSRAAALRRETQHGISLEGGGIGGGTGGAELRREWKVLEGRAEEEEAMGWMDGGGREEGRGWVENGARSN